MAYFVLIASFISKELKIGVYSFVIFGGFFSLISLKSIFKYLKCSQPLKKLPWTEIIFIFLIILFFLDLATKTLVVQEGAFQTSAAGYGDIPFHMNQISYFINNPSFSLQEPIYYGSKLTYPFLINLLSASFYFLNYNYLFSFHLPSFILAISAIILFYLLLLRYIKKPLIRICSFLIFFLASGLGFIKILKDSSFWAKNNIWQMIDFILRPPYYIHDYFNAVYPEQNNIWSSFFTMFLLHQRSMFFGFAIGVISLFCLISAYEAKDKKIFYFSGFLIGLSPLIHTHTFLALFLILISFFFISVIKKQSFLIKGFLKTTLIASIISLPSVLYLMLGKINGSFITFRLGWMTEKNGLGSVQYNPQRNFHLLEWLSFIWQNFGFFLPVLILAAVFIFFSKKYNGKQREVILALILSSFLIWIVLNIVKFQPWDYDNNKIYAYIVIMGAVIIGYFFDKTEFFAKNFFILLLTMLIIASGLIDSLSRSSLASPQLYQIFSSADRKIADWIIDNIKSNSLILTGNSHLNLVAALAGRPVLEGYPGWLWSHGFNYSQRENDISKIFKGDKKAEELIKKYNIKYIMIGPEERRNFMVNESFFDRRYQIILENSGIKIYKINND
jgi:hypothetical protein